MKKIIKLAEEIIPLSTKQGFFLLVIIASFFQMVLFYSPALAEEAVRNNNDLVENYNLLNTEDNNLIVKIMSAKSINPDEISARLIKESTQIIINEVNLNKGIDDLDLPIEDNLRKVAFIPEVIVSEPEIRVISSSFHSMTAYNSEVGQTDDSPCITANGFNVCEHGIEDTVAANFLPFGTKIRMPELFGDRIFIVRDRMNKRYSERVDIWMLKKVDALKFGVKRNVKIEVIEIIEPEIIQPKPFVSRI